MNDTTFWQDHEKGHNPEEDHDDIDSDDEYEYQYYYDYGEDNENGGADQWEYYDEMYVTPEEEKAPLPGAETPVVTYSTFRKPKVQAGKPAIVPHGTYPRDPLHYGHKHTKSSRRR